MIVRLTDVLRSLGRFADICGDEMVRESEIAEGIGGRQGLVLGVVVKDLNLSVVQ